MPWRAATDGGGGGGGVARVVRRDGLRRVVLC